MSELIIYGSLALIWLIGAVLTYRCIMREYVENGSARNYLDCHDSGIWMIALVWFGFWLYYPEFVREIFRPKK